jgi:hypothetical protein
MASTGVEFSINIVGDTTGEQFIGKFRAKEVLSKGDMLARDERRRFLIGDKPESAPVWVQKYAELFSQVEVRLLEAPTWWRECRNGIDLKDDNVLLDIWERVMKVEEEFRARRTAETDKAKAELTAHVKDAKTEDK